MFIFFKFLIFFLPILISVAFITLLERKVLSLVGVRLGPNKVSISGFLQPIMDAVKLANKQPNFLYNYSYFFYYISSVLMFLFSMGLWTTIMSEPIFICYKVGLFVLFLILGFNSLNSIILGWSTYSKYSLLGSIRTVSQLVSYEGVLYLCVFFFIFNYCLFNLYSFNFQFMSFFSLLVPVCFYIWIPTFLAELNRTPYDFSEGESELVSGFNVDFGSFCFTLIFLAEYSSIIFFCFLGSFLFFSQSLLLFFFFFFFLLFGVGQLSLVIDLMNWWGFVENFMFLF